MKFRDLTDMSGSDLFHWTMRRQPTVYRNTAKITIQENVYAPIQRANRINFECCALDMIGINAHNHAITELTLTVAANEFVARLYSLINYTNFTFVNSILFVEDEEAFYVSDEDASLYTMNIRTLESMVNTYENELDTKPSLSPSMESLYDIIKNQSLHFFKPLLEDGLLNPDMGIRKGERLYKLDVDKFIKRSDDDRKEYMAFLDSYSYLIDAYCYAIEKDGKKLDFDENKASNPLLYCVIDEEFSDNVKTDFRKKADVIIRDLDTYYGKLFDSTLKHLAKIQSFAEDYAMMREDDDEEEKVLSDRIQSANPNVDYAYTTCSHHFETDFDDEEEEKEDDSTELELKSIRIPPEEMEDLSEEPPKGKYEKPEEEEEKPKKRTTRKKKSEDSSSEEKPKKKRGRPKKVQEELPVEKEEEEVPELIDVSEGPSIKISIGCPVDEDGNPLPEDTEIVSDPIDFDELHRQDVTDTVNQETAIPLEETDTSDQSE